MGEIMRTLVTGLFLGLFLALFSVAPASAAVQNFGEYHAIVIGNNNYDDLSDLKSAGEDARAVAQLLKSQYGFKVRLLLDARREDVIGALAKVRAKLSTNDNLLIYYAGHGVLDEYAEEGYWLPVNAKKDDPSNWISNGDITNMVRAIRAKHVMVVSDSCFSGTLVRAASAKLETAEARNAWVERMNSKRSRTALVSGGLEPVIDSGGGAKHSVFAKAFMDTLRENTGILDGQRLFAAVGRPVALESDQTPQYSDIRRSGHNGGDFLFVRASAVQVASTAGQNSPVDATKRGISVDQKATAPAQAAPAANPAVELAFWSSIKDSKNASDFQAYLTEFPTGAFTLLAQNRIKQLSGTQVSSVAPSAPAPKLALASDHNGSYIGEILVTDCNEFNGGTMEIEIKNGKVSGYGHGNLQMNGKVVSPTKIRGDAWNSDGIASYQVTLKDGKWTGSWEGGGESGCSGTIIVTRR
jgi:hypothetical protein